MKKLITASFLIACSLTLSGCIYDDGYYHDRDGRGYGRGNDYDHHDNDRGNWHDDNHHGDDHHDWHDRD
jgi:hypothetical protein